MNRGVFLRIVLAIAIGLTTVLASLEPADARRTVNDRYQGNQTYLRQIRADQAWDLVTGNTGITIAVLDSGVDSDHPDLKENLLPGINLVTPGRPAEDDNGHGTSVTGILAARGNNGIGVSGVLWNARVLPIKVLDRSGYTDLDLLVEGIETAINRRAKVILMSVSSTATSRELEAVVRRAEAQGIVIVAATGNEGGRVSYPAAYPTVIAVGATGANNQPLYNSNFGPELNLMAPGRNIYTTKMGGRYGAISGTSAAAPQVAAAAAMILARHPQLSPLDVRQLLYQSAADLGEKGWDRKTGYGLLDINKALRSSLSPDFHEPNNTQSQAKAFPIESQLRGRIDLEDHTDWYFTDVPYDGKITLQATISSRLASPLAATFFVEGRQPATYYLGNGDTLSVPVRAGRMHVRMQRSGGAGTFTYLLTSRFTVEADRYERNNTLETARPLVGNQISLTGTFHEPNDQDWFSYYVRDNGKMQLTVAPDTNRMDIKLYIGKQGAGWDPVYDNSTREDQTERLTKEVTPGKYYIRVSEYYQNQVNGQYRMNLSFQPERKDPNEPNNTYMSAVPLSGAMVMTGTLPNKTDYDWFRFDVARESYVTVRAPYIPVQSGMQIALYGSQTTNYALAIENRVAELSDQGRPVLGVKLKPGRYYLRLTSTAPIKYDTYRLNLGMETLISGFRDIASHWARHDIARLSNKGIVSGFADATFRPDKPMTRAEFAAMLIKAMRYKGAQISTYSGRSPFKDLSARHWAYQNMMQAYRLGIMRGYANKTIKPNQPITRAEMAVMVARAQSLLMYKRSFSHYRDVSTDHWASPAIEALTVRGWLKGADGLFRPNAYARRAEMVVLLAKAYNL